MERALAHRRMGWLAMRMARRRIRQAFFPAGWLGGWRKHRVRGTENPFVAGMCSLDRRCRCLTVRCWTAAGAMVFGTFF
jgi:hypothetical protein